MKIDRPATAGAPPSPKYGSPARVLITGSRNWDDEESIRSVIDELPPGAVVIHGGARGADSIANHFALHRNLAIEVFPADWEKYGRAAGPIRNQRMLDEGKPDLAHAFLKPESRGTRDMIRRCLRAKVPVIIHPLGD